ncbi:MAG: aldehyde dehydrogenase family protein, partial [Rhodobacteraceae bacterium]|nr:aldehyde dehydrogenase family protein [Paracoccaceae bacterium]
MKIDDIARGPVLGPAPEDPRPAHDWIAASAGRFGLFIGGRWRAPREGGAFETINPATGEVLAHVALAGPGDVAAAVSAARRAQAGWAALGGAGRARHLYALSRLVQKHARLLAILESLDSGKPIRESRDIDIPLVARHFHHHAGAALALEDEFPGTRPWGVCAQVIPWNFPLLMLAWKVAPALAAGNTVVLKPAEWTPLTALCLAGIAQEAGLPPGVLNILTGAGETGAGLVAHKGVDKVAFTGSTEVGRAIRRATAGQGKGLTLELGGKSAFVVFEDADLDSAVEGLVDAIWFNGGQVCCAGSRLLVQEGVAEALQARLVARMEKLRVGDPLDKCIDIGAIAHPDQQARIALAVAGAEAQGGEVIQRAAQMPGAGCFYPPTYIAGLSPAAPLMQEEIFGPVLVGTTFRTPDEAIRLANDSRYGLAASVWTEAGGRALAVARAIRAGVVWVNGTNRFDAAAPFGGMRESGFGREGGRAGMAAYLCRARGPRLKPVAPHPAGRTPGPAATGLDRTAKLSIGGRQVRPDSGLSLAVHDAAGRLAGHVGAGNRKDIRNAVEAAPGAQPPRAPLGGAGPAPGVDI